MAQRNYFKKGVQTLFDRERIPGKNRHLNLLRLVAWLPHGEFKSNQMSPDSSAIAVAPGTWHQHHDTVTSNGCTRDISCRTTKVKLCLICTQRLQRATKLTQS